MAHRGPERSFAMSSREISDIAIICVRTARLRIQAPPLDAEMFATNLSTIGGPQWHIARVILLLFKDYTFSGAGAALAPPQHQTQKVPLSP